MLQPLCWAATLLWLIGLAHSVLGERYILTRLFRRTALPPLFGDDEFTRQTLRFAWHLTTVAWWCLAWMLWVLGTVPEADPRRSFLLAMTVLFGISAGVALVASRGRHFAWPVFLAIAILCWVGL